MRSKGTTTANRPKQCLTTHTHPDSPPGSTWQRTNRGVVLVTGASGFIGTQLVTQLQTNGYRVLQATRDLKRIANPKADCLPLPMPDDPTKAFEQTLGKVDHIVHLAAIHNPQFNVSADTYHRVNCVLAAKLAKAANQTISGKFVFISTIRAQCGRLHEGIARESDEPRPTDDYGRAKLAAEGEIADALPRSNFTILRPVLVYGADMGGNLAILLKLAALPLPLPLNALAGRRSLLDREALVRAIIHSLREAQTSAGTFIVSDKAPVTIPEIVTAVRRGLGRSPNLFSCPPWLLTSAAQIAGQADRLRRLSGDLVASPEKLQATGWVAVDDSTRRLEELSATLVPGRRYREALAIGATAGEINNIIEVCGLAALSFPVA